MKHYEPKFTHAVFILSILLIVFYPMHCEANVGRAAKHGSALLALLGYLPGLAGPVAVISSGLHAKGKSEDVLLGCMLVSGIGGIVTGWSWFGWPMKKTTTFIQGSYFYPGGYVDSSEFSFFRLIGLGVLAVIAAVACAGIASSQDKTNNKQ